MKTREIIIEPIISIKANAKGSVFTRRIFEYEVINLNIGDTIQVTMPYALGEKRWDTYQTATLVGYNEDHYFVMIETLGDNLYTEELVVLSYDA